MVPVSVVIITKNEADMLALCIGKAKLITDDIVVVDSGSTDETTRIAEANGCRVYHRRWDGYGANKNKGIALAKYNWILSLDADEVAGDGLISALHQLPLANPAMVYDIKFKTYFGQKLMRFGSWGRDHHLRLFNRNLIKWSESIVHEKLIVPRHVSVKQLGGYLNHYSVTDIRDCKNKALYYAKLSAEKYFTEGREPGIVKLYLAPLFSFFVNYFIRLGLLDGLAGLRLAAVSAKHTWLKYHLLNQMGQVEKKKQYRQERLIYSYTTD